MAELIGHIHYSWYWVVMVLLSLLNGTNQARGGYGGGSYDSEGLAMAFHLVVLVVVVITVCKPISRIWWRISWRKRWYGTGNAT